MGRRNHVLERYTPAEAEMVTGVNVALQRDWRRRELLPAVEGHARYTAAELAEMILMQDFAKAGLGPKALKKLLGTASQPLAKWVESLAWVNGVIAIEDAVPLHQLPAQYLVMAGGAANSAADLNQAFEALPADAGGFGFVCNLRRVAERVVAKVPRPVWRREPPQAVKEVP